MNPSILRAGATPEYWFEEGCYITEWSNSTADPALSVARARVPPGRTTRAHCLEGVTERYVILSGRGRIELGQDEPAEVGPGDVVIIAPGVSQRITNPGADDLVFLALCTPRFTPAAYRDLASGS